MKQKLFLLLALPFCWASTWALDQVGGVYQIGTAQDLVEFAALVNTGGDNMSANAVLTDDIDMTGIAWDNPIGVSGYKGHFDGQGYTISGLEYTTNQDNHGLFGTLNNGAVVENFTIYGNIENISYDAIAVVGYTTGTTIKICNIISYLNLTNSGNDKKIGGILGNGNNGTTNVDRCAFFGTIETTDKANVGGISGYIQNNTSTYVNFSNCLFDGEITTAITSAYCGGIVGYIGKNNTRYTVKNCLSLGTIDAPVAGNIIGYARNKGGGSSNNYILSGGKTYGRVADNCATTDYPATGVTAEQLASGEVAFQLNGNVNGGTNWYQTLGTDDYPLPYGTDKVYAVNRHCNGVTREDNTDYTNNTSNIVKDDHSYADGFCTYCDDWDASYMTANSEGYYEIGTANQLRWFAGLVNTGGSNMFANAKLTADITLETNTWTQPIGDWGTISGIASLAYKGHFNGSGKTIYNLTYTTACEYHGLFGIISTGALIENLTVYGTVTNESGKSSTVGIIAYARDATPTIRNIHSYLSFDNTFVGCRIGGVLGTARNGTIIVDRCTYSGTLATNDAENNGNYGGIVGYAYNNGNTKLTISNCLFAEDGVVKNTADTPGNCTFGGIGGFIGQGSVTTIKNCLSLGTITSTARGMICGKITGTKTVTNNYYKEGDVPANGSGSNTSLTAESVDAGQLSSGWVCAKLGYAFHQNLGSDATPTLDKTKGYVTQIGAAGYSTQYITDSDVTIPSGIEAFAGVVNGSSITLEPITNKIAAGEPVVLKGSEGFFNFMPTTGATKADENDLTGSDGTVSGGEGIYALAIKNGKVGFYPVAASVTIPAGKAYLEYTSTGSNSVKGFTFVFDDDATGIEDLKDSKDLKDSNVIYNIAGQRLDNSQFTIHNSQLKRGIYIVNGKKVLK